MKFDPTQYGKPIADILQEDRLFELGPGKPNKEMRKALESLEPEDLFSEKIQQADMAKACLSGLWLYHDFLDESHTISQSIPSATGSYWHGMMHRREPDFSNSKYWFRRVGRHPIFEALQQEARQIADEAGENAVSSYLQRGEAWDPFAFVDFCETYLNQDGEENLLCKKIQRREWELLFDFSYQQATQKPSS
jgi:hypothetical protein